MDLFELMMSAAMLVICAVMLASIEAVLALIGRRPASGRPLDPRPPGHRALPYTPA